MGQEWLDGHVIPDDMPEAIEGGKRRSISSAIITTTLMAAMTGILFVGMPSKTAQPPWSLLVLFLLLTAVCFIRTFVFCGKWDKISRGEFMWRYGTVDSTRIARRHRHALTVVDGQEFRGVQIPKVLVGNTVYVIGVENARGTVAYFIIWSSQQYEASKERNRYR